MNHRPEIPKNPKITETSETRTDPDATPRRFTCTQCGAAMAYQVGNSAIACTACGHRETVRRVGEPVKEYPLAQALKSLRLKPLEPPTTQVTCDNCGATSSWQVARLADCCPYCKTPIAKLDTAGNRLKIEAIIPFDVDKSQALQQLSGWLKNRWFAPNILKQMAGYSKPFEGVYVPHWTFDSLTDTDYRGQRGEHYIEYVKQTRVVNGKTETVSVPVTKTRWFPAAGHVRVMFDDVLVLASMLIPKTIVSRLRPWQLKRAVAYTPAYLAGLKADCYQVDLDEALTIAKQRMADDITRAIRRDIGGDVQQIHRRRTRYRNSTYKLMMLPVWYSAFEYRGKRYRIVINGQSGKVAGEYPKSPIKIAVTLAAGLILFGIAAYYGLRYP